MSPYSNLHAVNNGGAITVYQRSSLDSSWKAGTLYSGEVFTIVGETTGYVGTTEIRFLNSSGGYSIGFIKSTDLSSISAVYLYGTKVTISGTTYYRFKLRCALKLVYSSGSYLKTVPAGSYIFAQSATAGETNPANMKIMGYGSSSTAITSFSGFATLDYTNGSMIATNFCLQPY